MIEATIQFVKKALLNNESGHDWWHTYRVYKTAIKIAECEECNLTIVGLGALLHDISDAKLNGGDETKALEMARSFLETQDLNESDICKVLYIIEHISYRKTFTKKTILNPELAIVMDADRLDAIGAIGIARAFNYGGYKNRPIYDPDTPMTKSSTYSAYTNEKSPTINHFYDKLLKIINLMNTDMGKKMAIERHQFMKNYLDQFYKEWNSL